MASYTIDKIEYDSNTYNLQDNTSGYTTNTGTVTSVGISNATNGGLSISGSPVTGSGTITVGLASAYGDTKNPYGSKTANYVLAAPSGSAGTPSFRALTATDIPDLSGTYVPITNSVVNGTITATGTITNAGHYISLDITKLNGSSTTFNGNITVNDAAITLNANGTDLTLDETDGIVTTGNINADTFNGNNLNGGRIYSNDTTSSSIVTEGGILAKGDIVVQDHTSPIGTIIDSYLTSAISAASAAWVEICHLTLDPGVWLITCGVRWPSNTTGRRQVNISETSADNTLNYTVAPVNGTVTQVRWSRIFNLTAQKTYYLNASHTAGTTLTMPVGDAESINFMRATRIA